MSDPRLNDPRTPPIRDPYVNEPVATERSGGSIFGWLAGLVVVALIAFVVLAGWNSGKNTAGMAPPTPVETSQSTPVTPPVRNVTPPSTTGSGSTAPERTGPPNPGTPTGN